MDPNETLAKIRRLVAAVQDDRENIDQLMGSMSDMADQLLTLAESVEALDGWLSKGGFLPAAWDPRQSAYEGLPEVHDIYDVEDFDK